MDEGRMRGGSSTTETLWRADKRALWEGVRIRGLSRDQFEPFRTRVFLQCLEPGASRSRMLGLHLNLAERE
jgi:hypothetical protein